MSASDREQAVAKALKVLESQADIIGRYDWEDSSSQAVLEAFWILRGALPVLETPPPPNDEKKKEVRRAFRVEARNDPLGVDVSDFGDEFIEGFLNGQENALDFIEMVLDGTMATFDQARFVKPWLEALPGAPVEPVPAPRLWLTNCPYHRTCPQPDVCDTGCRGPEGAEVLVAPPVGPQE